MENPIKKIWPCWTEWVSFVHRTRRGNTWKVSIACVLHKCRQQKPCMCYTPCCNLDVLNMHSCRVLQLVNSRNLLSETISKKYRILNVFYLISCVLKWINVLVLSNLVNNMCETTIQQRTSRILKRLFIYLLHWKIVNV